ncbi:hypothetical protein TARUN_5016 [Trichoderma arundinaceum]|uniref:Uncharacterized protein n=1 Tax=Trichoderma arundinaceum TaxID=490622 RepID=A0A395NMB3_TRIAR|nr:hypothetical protein TARUN_5016 [Trichoderma arundinaceum]
MSIQESLTADEMDTVDIDPDPDSRCDYIQEIIRQFDEVDQIASLSQYASVKRAADAATANLESRLQERITKALDNRKRDPEKRITEIQLEMRGTKQQLKSFITKSLANTQEQLEKSLKEDAKKQIKKGFAEYSKEMKKKFEKRLDRRLADLEKRVEERLQEYEKRLRKEIEREIMEEVRLLQRETTSDASGASRDAEKRWVTLFDHMQTTQNAETFNRLDIMERAMEQKLDRLVQFVAKLEESNANKGARS